MGREYTGQNGGMGTVKLVTLGDGKSRCSWCAGHDDYVAYHDKEWGFPVADDASLFEKFCLEGFQSGLSWLTILRKREAFRRSFAEFDMARVARFGSREIARMLGDASIVRHRGKIESVIGNARRALELREEFGSIAAYVWGFEPKTATAVRTGSTSPESIALSKDLKKRGWTYVGPTTIYAFMQAMGLVNDHASGCVAWPSAERARRQFARP
jgi:DNA-3-methyladenine glycosylase I